MRTAERSNVPRDPFILEHRLLTQTEHIRKQARVSVEEARRRAAEQVERMAYKPKEDSFEDWGYGGREGTVDGGRYMVRVVFDDGTFDFLSQGDLVEVTADSEGDR